MLLRSADGIAFGDVDRDGYIDVYAAQGRLLWRNLGGVAWDRIDLSALSTNGVRYYGSSFGDFNEDGLPDLLLASRRFTGCAYMLQNEGGGNFSRVEEARMEIIPCGLDAESIAWADVDGDGLLDVVLPAYAHRAGERNHFWHNLGPASDGRYHLEEVGIEAGFQNLPPVSMGDRSEGAQFVDMDSDGDVDFYVDGVIHQNNSMRGTPSMTLLSEATSGVLYHQELEEGIAFADYDMDGDYDLIAVYTRASLGVLIWENEGDGTFFEENSVVESPERGLNLGISIEDWDNDGDMDLTTRYMFRTNMLMETGARGFVVADHAIPSGHISSATPSWGDFDHDGDLDTALATGPNVGGSMKTPSTTRRPPTQTVVMCAFG